MLRPVYQPLLLPSLLYEVMSHDCGVWHSTSQARKQIFCCEASPYGASVLSEYQGLVLTCRTQQSAGHTGGWA